MVDPAAGITDRWCSGLCRSVLPHPDGRQEIAERAAYGTELLSLWVVMAFAFTNEKGVVRIAAAEISYDEELLLGDRLTVRRGKSIPVTRTRYGWDDTARRRA